MRRIKLSVCGFFLALLGGCKSVVLDPSGDIALQQRDLLIDSTLLMLLIIVPVILATLWVSWYYRSSNEKVSYDPHWDHSTHLELVIWSAPLLIVICLGALTWLGTHLLDPYRELDRLSASKDNAPENQPLEIDVVALDWKWLFIYPEYGVATVNEVAAPIDRPIDFHITAANVMNSFYIPALAGQIYAMPAMETRLHAVINEAGDYKGFSANYSGAGFSGMHFIFHGQTDDAFQEWIHSLKAKNVRLDKAVYTDLVKPSENVAPIYYSTIEKDLYPQILSQCAIAGAPCEPQTNSMPQMTTREPHTPSSQNQMHMH